MNRTSGLKLARVALEAVRSRFSDVADATIEPTRDGVQITWTTDDRHHSIVITEDDRFRVDRLSWPAHADRTSADTHANVAVLPTAVERDTIEDVLSIAVREAASDPVTDT